MKNKTYLSKLILSFCMGLLYVSNSSNSIAIGDGELNDIQFLGRLPYLKNAKAVHISSSDTTGNNADYRIIKAGEALTLAEMKGPGVITHIWVTMGDKRLLRNLILKMYWDGEKDPSVQVPLGDFFGVGFSEYRHFSSLLIGMTSGGYYSYIPMPFGKSAKVQIANLTSNPIGIIIIWIIINYENSKRMQLIFMLNFEEKIPPSRGKITLSWKQMAKDISWVPFFLCRDLSPALYGTWKGMKNIYIDDETHPSWTGTGAEDYFLSGYYFTEGPYYQQGNDGTFSAPSMD